MLLTEFFLGDPPELLKTKIRIGIKDCFYLFALITSNKWSRGWEYKSRFDIIRLGRKKLKVKRSKRRLLVGQLTYLPHVLLLLWEKNYRLEQKMIKRQAFGSHKFLNTLAEIIRAWEKQVFFIMLILNITGDNSLLFIAKTFVQWVRIWAKIAANAVVDLKLCSLINMNIFQGIRTLSLGDPLKALPKMSSLVHKTPN